MDYTYTILPLGEAGLLVRFGSAIRPDIHRCVKALADQLDRHPFPGLIETVISYTSLAVYYDPFRVRQSGGPAKTASAFQSVSRFLKEEAIPLADTGTGAAARIVEIPVCYGGECGPDLPFVAEHCGLSEKEVIRIHTGPEYLVYMIGFCPGFPYLGAWTSASPHRAARRRVWPFLRGASASPANRPAAIPSPRPAAGRSSGAPRRTSSVLTGRTTPASSTQETSSGSAPFPWKNTLHKGG